MAKVLCPECSVTTIDARAARCKNCRYGIPSVPEVAPKALKPAPTLEEDRRRIQEANATRTLSDKYRQALDTIATLERDLGIKRELAGAAAPEPVVVGTKGARGEATVIAVASDWHYEERVGEEMGSIENRYNLDIARDRINRFFRKVDSLTKMLAQDIEIKTIVLALLGDFITNDIHGGEQAEANQLAPMHALVDVQNRIIGGIRYLLASSDRNLIIPCHSGNHARVTHKTRFHAENGHSLEYLMFQTLKAVFEHEPRVQFIIPEGPHSYLDVQGVMVRFQHGHLIKYGGGVGGLYIPMHKAVAQFNRARHADLDIMGHFHQLVDGGNFIVNGSLIGYNSFALSLKASFEKPKQALILIDSKRGRTALWPIYV